MDAEAENHRSSSNVTNGSGSCISPNKHDTLLSWTARDAHHPNSVSGGCTCHPTDTHTLQPNCCCPTSMTVESMDSPLRHNSANTTHTSAYFTPPSHLKDLQHETDSLDYIGPTTSTPQNAFLPNVSSSAPPPLVPSPSSIASTKALKPKQPDCISPIVAEQSSPSPVKSSPDLPTEKSYQLMGSMSNASMQSSFSDDSLVMASQRPKLNDGRCGGQPPGTVYNQNRIMSGPGGYGMQYAVRPVNMMCNPYSAGGGGAMYMAGPPLSVVSPMTTPTSLAPPNLNHVHHSHGPSCCSHCGTATTPAEIPSLGLVNARWQPSYEVMPLTSLTNSMTGQIGGNGEYLWTNPYSFPNSVTTNGHNQRHGPSSGPYMDAYSAPVTPLNAPPSSYPLSPSPFSPSFVAAQPRPRSRSHIEEDSLNEPRRKVSPPPVQIPANSSPSVVVPTEPPHATATVTAIAAQSEVTNVEVSEEEVKPLPGPLAFTIDFGETKKDTPKRVFPPKHRRTPSSQSVGGAAAEDNTLQRKSQEPEPGADNKMLKMRMPLDLKKSYLAASEGYFSSDQEEENGIRRNNLSAKTPRSGSASSSRRPPLQRTDSNPKTKRTPSPSPLPLLLPKETMNAPRNNNQIVAATNESSRPLQYHVNSLKSAITTTTPPRHEDRKGNHANVGGNNVLNALGRKEEDDDVSETGTYTVDKESPSPEEEQSRKDIDRVFGVDCNKTLRNTPTQDHADLKGSTRGTPNWICEWAAQVAQQQQNSKSETPPPRRASREVSPNRKSDVTTSKPPAGPVTNVRPVVEVKVGRPRRKLPSVPTQGHSRSRSSARNSDFSDADSPTGNKSSTSYSDRHSPVPNLRIRGESNHETESFLRDTESVVSAMQARMDRGRGFTSSLESHDSGGDSDVDTSTSYSITTPTAMTPRAKSAETYRDYGVDAVGRKLSAQLKAKLKSLDIDEPHANSKTLLRETSYVVSRGQRQESVEHAKYANSLSPLSDSESNGKLPSHYEDGKSLESDTESEGTESPRVTLNPAPTIRYNRALSLRRGRLGLDTDSQSQERRRGTTVSPSPTPTSHANRKLSHSSKPPSSFKTPPPLASTVTEVQKSAFSRTDGGRFSLRVSTKSQIDKAAGAKPKQAKTPSLTHRQPSSHSPSPNPVGSIPSAGNQNSNSNGQSGRRSSSTLSSKEAEFQNWKRRKTYDPMKAAAEGRKKDAAKKQVNEPLHPVASVPPMMSQSMMAPSLSPCHSPSPPRTIIRSASFTYVNDSQAEEECSPSPTRNLPKPIHHQWEERISDKEDLCLDLRKLNLGNNGSGRIHASARISGLEILEDNSSLSPGSPRHKAFGDDSSDVTRVSRSSNSSASIRTRSKLEALDNLVINTIFGLSGKIRCHADALLRKLKPQFADDVERLATLDDTILRLSEAETPPGPSMAARSTSRELSGTLKVMKRIEQVFLVLDQVLFEEGVEGGGEETINLEDVEGKWNGYHSGDFY